MADQPDDDLAALLVAVAESSLDRMRRREAAPKCRFCGKPGPYFGRCADHWDVDDGMHE